MQEILFFCHHKPSLIHISTRSVIKLIALSVSRIPWSGRVEAIFDIHVSIADKLLILEWQQGVSTCTEIVGFARSFLTAVLLPQETLENVLGIDGHLFPLHLSCSSQRAEHTHSVPVQVCALEWLPLLPSGISPVLYYTANTFSKSQGIDLPTHCLPMTFSAGLSRFKTNVAAKVSAKAKLQEIRLPISS